MNAQLPSDPKSEQPRPKGWSYIQGGMVLLGAAAAGGALYRGANLVNAVLIVTAALLLAVAIAAIRRGQFGLPGTVMIWAVVLAFCVLLGATVWTILNPCKFPSLAKLLQIPIPPDCHQPVVCAPIEMKRAGNVTPDVAEYDFGPQQCIARLSVRIGATARPESCAEPANASPRISISATKAFESSPDALERFCETSGWVEVGDGNGKVSQNCKVTVPPGDVLHLRAKQTNVCASPIETVYIIGLE